MKARKLALLKFPTPQPAPKHPDQLTIDRIAARLQALIGNPIALTFYETTTGYYVDGFTKGTN